MRPSIVPRGLFGVQSGLRQRQQFHVAKHCMGEHSRPQLSFPFGDFVNHSQYRRRHDDINLHRLGRKLGKVDIYQSPNTARVVFVSSVRLNGCLLWNELTVHEQSFDIPNNVLSRHVNGVVQGISAREAPRQARGSYPVTASFVLANHDWITRYFALQSHPACRKVLAGCLWGYL